MITELGKDLSVVIVTELGKDWQAFATWYSVFKNLPDANVSIVSFRNGETPFQMFQWAKRLKIPLIHAQPTFDDGPIVRSLEAAKFAKRRKLTSDQILVIPHLTMFLKSLDSKTIDLFGQNKPMCSLDTVFLPNCNIDEILNDILLDVKTLEHKDFCHEAKETESLSSIVSYQKGCGKWIHKLKGCPFSNAAGLVSSDMTVNELRIIDLWKRMCQLYSAVL